MEPYRWNATFKLHWDDGSVDVVDAIDIDSIVKDERLLLKTEIVSRGKCPSSFPPV